MMVTPPLASRLPNVSTNAKFSGPPALGLTPKQQLVTTMIYIACNLGTNFVTPITTNYQFKRDALPLVKRKELVQQEIVRQMISASIFLGTFGGGLMTGRLVGKGKPYQSMLSLGLGYVASFLGYAFVRPMMTAGTLSRWMYWPEEGKETQSLSKPTQWFRGLLNHSTHWITRHEKNELLSTTTNLKVHPQTFGALTN